MGTLRWMLKRGNSSLLGPVRMDNLPKAHIQMQLWDGGEELLEQGALRDRALLAEYSPLEEECSGQDEYMSTQASDLKDSVVIRGWLPEILRCTDLVALDRKGIVEGQGDGEPGLVIRYVHRKS